jgi:hypothetical protein
MGAHPRYVEELRVGGGYLSTPDGGLDIDKAGNLALDGDLTLSGDLALGVGGVNRTWGRSLQPRDAALGVPGAAEGPLDTNHGIFSVNFSYLAFDPTTREWAHWAIALPPDYNGAALKFTVYWYAAAGTVSATVTWRVRAACINDLEVVVGATGLGAGATDTITALSTLHVPSITMTPDNAASGGLLAVSLERTADTDTFNGDARLIALHVAYA